MKKLIEALAIAIACLMMTVGIVYAAVSAPDTLIIYSANAYRGVLQGNDQLHIFAFEINYATNPTDYTAAEAFLFRLYENDIEIATAVPYAYYDSGYDQGVIGFYFQATDPDIPAWESANLELVLVGNPALDWGGAPPSDSYAPWDSFSSLKVMVGIRVRALAIGLDSVWVTEDLIARVQGVNKLTSYGETYFETVIPNLRTISPELFIAVTTAPDIPTETHTTDYGDTVEQRWLAGWESPTGSVDAGAQWATEGNAYDGDTATFSTGTVPAGVWGSYLELTHAAIDTSFIRYWHTRQNADIDLFDLDVFYGGAWHTLIDDGLVITGAWLERGLGDTYSVTSARVRYHNTAGGARTAYVHELEFGGNPTFDMTNIANLFSTTNNWAGSILYIGVCVGILYAASKRKNGALGMQAVRPALFLFGALLIMGSFLGFMPFEVGLFCGIGGGIAMVFSLFWRGAV